MITPFNPSVIERAIEVVDRSGAAEELLHLLSPPKRGRRPSYNTRAFLVGALLAVQWKGSLVVRDIHRVLVGRLPLDTQRELSIRSTGPDGTDVLLSEQHLYRILTAMGRYLEFGTGSLPDLSDTEREARRSAVLGLLHSLLAVTLPESASTSRAIDGTGIWSYGKQPRKAPSGLLKLDASGEELTQVNPAANTDTDAVVSVAFDPDAGHGVKTRKDGGRETYYGYQLHALVRVPDYSGQDGFIPLFETFELSPAQLDIVDPSLGLIDRSVAMGNTVTDLLADRHYSYKTADRWFYELMDRDVRQHVDLHPNDQGFRNYEGMKMAAAWMHCPSTPARLGTIASAGPTASAATKAEFAASIDERQQFAMRRVSRQSATTGARWECPAINGTVGCPLREGTVEVAQLNGLPVVVEPPDLATAPKCCTQRTVSTGLDAQAKIEQEHYWGSEKWRLRYNARTYVEGAFGNLKNTTTENVERGFFQVVGLAKVSFMVGIALVAHNLRMLRGNTDLFAVGEGDVLLQQDADCHGFVFLTAEEEQVISTMRQKARVDATAA